MDWWQIALLVLITVIVGTAAGIFIYYLIKRLPIKVNLGSGLLPLNLLSLLLILVIIFFPSNVLRIILATPFLLFFSGYTLTMALFPRRAQLAGINRAVLSFGLSIIIAPIIGFILNYTPLGISLETVLYSLASFILITSIIAWFRLGGLSADERFVVRFQLVRANLGADAWDKALTIIISVTTIFILVILGYLIVTPKGGETFTEFYILGQEGEAANYPRELKIGEECIVSIGIVNHEGREISYLVEVQIDQNKISEIGPVVLADEQKWEGQIDFMPKVAGEKQKIEFVLYENGENDMYWEPLHLWANVSE